MDKMNKNERERLEKLTKNDCTFEEYVKAVHDVVREDSTEEETLNAMKIYQYAIREDYEKGKPVSSPAYWVWNCA